MNLLRELPPVHLVQEELVEKGIATELPQSLVKEMIQQELNEIRHQLLNNSYNGTAQSREEFLNKIIDTIHLKSQQSGTLNLKSVINATGVVLHTNLGRARLSEAALEHMVEVARSYSTLEYNLEKGERGSRHSITEEWICKLTGAEAAMVVNNNAAAVFLILSALANEKEVIVSRGELVEIGGSFRVSSIMEESGAKLTEVGTTNKTHPYDYENGITDETAMLMKVHRSNFALIGFTAEVERSKLANIARTNNVIFYEDLGSGALFDYRKTLIGDEPTVQETLEAGADLVSFSGDKLLGGPQAGMIAGKKDLIDQLKKHQLARVLRVDKFTLAALEATLKQHLFNETDSIPAIRDITKDEHEIKSRAESFEEKLQLNTSSYVTEIVQGTSQVGGGTMPAVELPTYILSIASSSFSVNELEERLRTHTSPVITRINGDRILMDFRTITESEEDVILDALMEIAP
ncbi:L-seryl-tRNA(Sec) selenium transferase [Guptibacillus hwajinpoensis]|uniref:L-seryl-tRNA(Sec) selenium transferase n=1 Tax=Guptibacillus hwajinpoensis TaxID=208199 RepID=A0ABU0K0V8_9BACL|nr:L-seryl-tRNA(Sec) selenium transferase [Alkalihalobacillus hemicentroti]MDQ0482974.1 L-seryl-tRNA(Ser) seleniumtransferase [Alkalihalobacillus hemicentroti]